jgi:hypothetical protein
MIMPSQEGAKNVQLPANLAPFCGYKKAEIAPD